jgi:hypothetical protein
LRDFGSYLMMNHRLVYEHIVDQLGVSIEACFTSQIITLFIYDLEFEEATRIFELYLLDGEQVIVDLLATFVELRASHILTLYELDLMNYLRKGMVDDTLKQHKLVNILPRRPKVQLIKSIQHVEQNDTYFR